jgi:tetratricopeptide (TPR) repeat protein
MQDYDEAIRLDPKHVLAFHNRGNAWKVQKEYDKALQDYNEALRLDPGHVLTLNSKAGLLATCSVEKIRDGKKAVELATRACELTKWKNPAYLSTLAACCAETGDFAKAVEWQEKALEDAEYAKAFGQVLLQRLQLYKDDKPFREE